MADASTTFRLKIPKRLDALRTRISTSIRGINTIILRLKKSSATIRARLALA
jgi:hypothetical protein